MPAIPNNTNNTNTSVVSVNSALIKPSSVNGLSADTKSLNGLRSQAAADPKSAAREAAKQFESLFMGELVKSMRGSTQATGMLDNAGTQLGTELLDQQLSGQISGRPGGLADIILKQVERQMGMASGPNAANGANNGAANGASNGASNGAVNGLAPGAASTPRAGSQPTRLQGQPTPPRSPQTGPAGFVLQHMAAAREAETATGIPASFMVSQAALETGWGRKEIKHSDGSPSFNLFGIKAGGSWKGPVAEVSTTEFINGKPSRVMAKFRAYGSYAESFADYARLMSNSPRYQNVLKGVQQAQAVAASPAAPNSTTATRDNAVRFAQNMQRAGYATDPEYADKLSRVINTTLRLQRSLVA